jgi:hypothetical protein
VRFLETGTDIIRRRGSTLPLFVTPGVTDKSLYDWTSVNFVAPNYGHKKADIYSAELEQIIVDRPMHLLAAQLGFYREDVDEYSRNFISGNSAVLYVDPNRTRLDGTPNPFYLRPYIGASEPTTFSRPSINDNGRLQVAYQLNFEQAKAPWMHWLGRHRALGYLEGRRITTGLYRFRELVLDNHTWVNPANRANGNAANRAYFKYYLGDNQAQNIDYPPPALYGVSGSYDFHWLDGTTGQWITEPATIGQAAYISNRTQQEIRSRGGVLQSFFLDERVVTTVGTRRDKNRSRDSNGAVIDPATGFYSYAPLNVWQNWEEQQGTTSTRGIVVKPFRGWSMLDRRADNGSFPPTWCGRRASSTTRRRRSSRRRRPTRCLATCCPTRPARAATTGSTSRSAGSSPSASIATRRTSTIRAAVTPASSPRGRTVSISATTASTSRTRPRPGSRSSIPN